VGVEGAVPQFLIQDCFPRSFQCILGTFAAFFFFFLKLPESLISHENILFSSSQESSLIFQIQ